MARSATPPRGGGTERRRAGRRAAAAAAGPTRVRGEGSSAVPVAGRLLRRLAIPVPAEWPARPVPGLRQWALDLAAELPRMWSATGRPFPRRLLDAVVEGATVL